MIHFDAATRVFHLLGARSFYACRVDDGGRVVHVGWGPRPAGLGDAPVVSGRLPTDAAPWAGQDTQVQPDEVLTFGDYSYHEVTLKVAFPTVAGTLAAGEAPHVPVRDVRLRYADHDVVTDAQPGFAPTHGRPTWQTADRETLRIRLEDPVHPFGVTLCLRLTPEHDVIERWLELENRGAEPVAVEQCFFGSLHLPAGPVELTHCTGAWAAEFSTERRQLPVGQTVLESRTIHTGCTHHPFFLVNRCGQAWEDSGVVYFGQLAYSGNWRLAFEHRPDGATVVHGGYNPFDFALTLEPGARHATPALVHGCSDGGWGGASRRMHAFIRERVLPRPAEGPELRPVLFNSWEATYFDVTPDGQAALARQAADLGVELFCVDDGWFGGRRYQDAGLGDWVVSPDVFPDGLQPLIDEVRGLGMRFGLWVEPEMVNPNSDLYRAHPEWVLHFPGRPRTTARDQLILDLGRSEVVEYLYTALDALVAEYAIDFFKWDMNRAATEPGSVVGKAIWRAHTAGVYALMDRLRCAHPHLTIESCSSGGARIDAGILARTDQVWTSDNTDAFDRVRIQEGYSLAYPARAMECWVTHERNHQTGRRLSLDLRFDVAMRGALGIGSDLNALDDRERRTYAEYIAFYKRIRPIVQTGTCYRLQRLEEAGASIVQYVLPDASAAVYSVVVVDRRVGQRLPPARLRGLDPAASYRAVDREATEIFRATGTELMALGLPGNVGGGWYVPGYSRTLHLMADHA